jgi:ATP-dependent Clp protease ATP-binding subunit ClpC
MSEYAGFDAASRLLGTPDAPSPLIRQMREQPFSVVLFDEIEKAADEVFDVLLGVCDEGRLTDRFGRVTTFRSAVVIMTSNLGATSSGGFGFGGPLAEADLTAVREFFRPEFFNRLDGVVRFQALRPEAIRTITAGELRRLNEREGLRAAGLTLTWSDRLLDDLARVGFDERYGARPLQRAIEQQLVAPLAAWLLEHADVRGQTIQADRADDGVAFTLV